MSIYQWWWDFQLEDQDSGGLKADTEAKTFTPFTCLGFFES